MKTNIIVIYLLLILVIHSNLIATSNQSDSLSSTQLIRDSFLQKQISYSNQIKYFAYSLVTPTLLPKEYRSNKVEKCGSWINDMILNNWNKLTTSSRKDLLEIGFNEYGIMGRPGFLDETTETDHFMIHYSIDSGDSNAVDVTDNNSNGIPDYIDLVIDISENVWRKEIDTMQYTAPPSDGGIFENAKFDLYIYDIGKYYGLTWGESFVGDNPNSIGITENNAFTGYIAFNNNYSEFSQSDEDALKVTMAHEFMHAIENGYDGKEKSWLKEVTSTWVEDEVYDAINDNYQYLDSWFKVPSYSLDDSLTAGHWYGSWIFARYLSEHFGQNIIKTIWEKSIINNSKTTDFSTVALETALNDYGTTFPTQFTNFAIANLVKNVPPYNYEEYESYPKAKIDDIIFSNYLYTLKIRKRGAKYFKISKNLNIDGTDELKITFSEVSTTDDFSATIITRTGTAYNFHKFYPGNNTYTFNNTSTLDEIFLVVTNNTTSTYSDDWFSAKIVEDRNTNAEILYEGNITSLLSGEKTVGWTTSWDTLHFFSNFPYKKVTEIIDFNPARHGNQLIWTTNHVNSEVLNAYKNKKTYQISKTEFDEKPNNVPKFSTTSSNVEPQIDDGYGWASGFLNSTSEAGLFRIKVQKSPKFEKISEQVLDISDKLIVDGKNAVWSFVESNQNKQINFYNGSVKNIKKYNFSDFYGITDFDFDADKIVWLENGTNNQGTIFQRLKCYTISTSTEDMIDSVSFSFMFPETGREIKYFETYGNKIVWSVVDYDKDSLTIYLKNSNKSLLFSEKKSSLSNESYFSFRMNNDGVGWIEGNNMPLGRKTFHYLDFGTNTKYQNNITVGDIYYLLKWDIVGDDFYMLASNENNLRVKLIKLNIKNISTDIKSKDLPEEIVFSLSQNYPNPFNPSTLIKYQIPKDIGREKQEVKLIVYDILGREIAILVNKVQKAGSYEVEFNSSVNRQISSGVYIYSLKTGSYYQSKKMILIK